MKYVNSILVRQLIEANKGTKVEISASTVVQGYTKMHIRLCTTTETAF